MALQRKHSRLITIAGETYRWTVSNARQARTDLIAVVVEWAAQPGQRLQVHVPCRDFWLDLPEFTSRRRFNADAYRPVTPAMVRGMILSAMAAGWTPEKRGKPLTFFWNHQEKYVSATEGGRPNSTTRQPLRGRPGTRG